MSRFIVPLILVVAAIGLFALYTNGAYQADQALAAQVTSYDDALNKSQQLRALRDQLLAKRGTFAPDDVSKLERVLPDNVDNIRLIIDINSIAARHNLSLKDVSLGDVSGSSEARSSLAVGTTGDKVGSVTVGFTINAGYDNMLAFLEDLERSVRIVDVEKLAFKTQDKNGNSDYAFTIRTYWLH